MAEAEARRHLIEARLRDAKDLIALSQNYQDLKNKRDTAASQAGLAGNQAAGLEKILKDASPPEVTLSDRH